MKHKKQPQAKQAAPKKRGRKPKPAGAGVRDWYHTQARLRPDIAKAVRADEAISVNAAINDSLARRYGLPPYVP